MLFAVERVMDSNQRAIALSVLESLRGDLVYAHLNNGSRVLDVADTIRTSPLALDVLYSHENGYEQDIGKSNGHSAKADS